MNVDYVIVGCGLAGISFCEQLKANNKSFAVFDNQSQQSSVVAGGLYNPVILKRFTPVWRIQEQLDMALPMYAKLEEAFGIVLDYEMPVLRRFASTEEQNNWFIASDQPILKHYLSTKLIPNTNLAIDAPFGFGEVLHTGRIDTRKLVTAYRKDLLTNNRLIEQEFIYSHLENSHYKEIEFKHIVFAEGFGIKKNPFFSNLPLKPSKGELLTIYAPELKIDAVIKSNIFIFPFEDHLYSVGATYEWKDETNDITEKGRNELLSKLKKLIKCPFEVVNQVAGIRPTVSDRRPLVGKHQTIDNMYVLNGLGTRGVLIGPYMAKQLYNHIETNEPLEAETDIKRFDRV